MAGKQMKFFPYERYSVSTRLSSEQVLRKLRLEVGPVKFFRWPVPNEKERPFEGELNNEGFKIWRVTYLRNDFIPIFDGRIKRLPEGSIIDIRIRFSWWVISFLVLFALVGLFLSIYLFIQNNFSIKLSGLIPLAAYAFLYAFTTFLFKIEVSEFRNNFTRLLAAE
jgi:hypothetical protein